MKIDKNNYRHWFYLLRSAAIILLTLPLCLFSKKNIVILYGHKHNGNLLALYDFIMENDHELEVYFLTLNPRYFRQLQKEKVNVLHMGSLLDMGTVARAGAIVTDHGMHTLILYRLLTSIKFVDVWHGLSFKGFDSASFKHLHGHDELWVQSETMKWFYINKFGFQDQQVKVTGYGRVDKLVLNDFDRAAILEKYKIPDRKTVLIAPTWIQDHKNRSILPFGASMNEFFNALENVGRRNNATIIFRVHLNTGDTINIDQYDYVKVMPYSKYPVAEEFLYISDILITDWSSIATDYLPLKRPTIFLDVPAPFSKGFTLGPEHRFGEVVGSMEELTTCVDKYLNAPEAFLEKYDGSIKKTIEVAFGFTFDGKARERYILNLKRVLSLNKKQSALLVTRNLPPLLGGMERLNYHVALALDESLSLAVIGPSGCSNMLPESTAASEAPPRPLWRFLVSSGYQTIRIALKNKPGLVMAGSGLTAPLAWIASRLSDSRSAVYLHGLDIIANHSIYRLFWIPFLRRFDIVIVNSQSTANLAITIGISQKQLTVINPGTEFPALDPAAPEAFRKKYALNNRPLLLSVGRLTPRKGLIPFIQGAFPGIVNKYPDVCLVVLGDEAPDALTGSSIGAGVHLDQLAVQLGVSKNLIRLGPCDDKKLSAAYCAANVHIFPVIETPGDIEGFGMVALEAAAHGLPTVAFRVGGVPDAISQGVSGYLVKPGDYYGMQQQILDILGGGPRSISKASCRGFAEKRTWHVFYKKLKIALGLQETTCASSLNKEWASQKNQCEPVNRHK